MDVSVVLPVTNERGNLEVLLPRLKSVLERERVTLEVVVDGVLATVLAKRHSAASAQAFVKPE